MNPQMFVRPALAPSANKHELSHPSIMQSYRLVLRFSTNLVIILGMMQVSKKIPFEDPQVLMGIRALYIISNLIILGIYLFMQQKINSKKGTCT